MTKQKLTPMMVQYQAIKNEIPDDCILFFRLGDFYEMFFEDAQRASALMDLNLTARGGYPMCGFPYHALDNYLPNILEAGVKVAIAEQVEDPKEAKGIVKRAVTRIITPGTLIDSNVLNPNQNNFLVALTKDKNGFGLSSLDISTADFMVTELKSFSQIENELERLNVRECVLTEDTLNELKSDPEIFLNSNITWTVLDDWTFAKDYAIETLLRQLNVGSLDGFGCRDMSLGVMAAGAVLYYATENLRHTAQHITRLRSYSISDFMELDSISQRNLELISPLHGNNKKNTLLYTLNKTVTPMGSRLLSDYLVRPLYNKQKICERLDAVECFFNDPLTLAEIQEILRVVRDLERIIARVNIGSANARDLLSLANSLNIMPAIKDLVAVFSSELLERLNMQITAFDNLVDLIRRAIKDEVPLTITDGGVIKEGYNAELDELQRASSEGKSWLAKLQAEEQQKTNIKNLKIKFNKVFGYYFEVSNGNLSLVPDYFIRRQTLVNAERFITPELKEMEGKILGSEEKSKALEYQLFQEIRDFCLQFTNDIQTTANAIAQVDIMVSFADCARINNYTRPHISEDLTLNIKDGRHPVLDATMTDDSFVPNDTILDGEDNRMMIITGPNMAGKSTYIRQSALLVLMAQIGSFIPASEATIGLVDRIFTRVGAADDIARGQSTFMVEMVETANILNHCTPKSLVILDEIGRGTSTFDGVSIAWAVAEFLHDTPESCARTQFATHYHELTELALTRSGVKNYNVAVKEYDEQIIFLRKIIQGSADKSYGIHVAKLAGLPVEILERADEILENLENNSTNNSGQPTLAEYHKVLLAEQKKRRRRKTIDNERQQTLF